MKEPIFGHHIGIVVSSDDTESRSRVQVYIPHLSATLYENWNKTAKDEIVISQGNGSIDSEEVFKRLREILPWAEAASQQFGFGGTTYRDNPSGLTKPQPSAAPQVPNVANNSLTPEKTSQTTISNGDAQQKSPNKFIDFANMSEGDKNMVKWLASLATPETGFSASEATSDACNQLADGKGSVKNVNVLAEYKKITGTNWQPGMPVDAEALKTAQDRRGDYGYYQINDAQENAELRRAGYTDIDLRSGTAAEQTQKMAFYLDNVINKNPKFAGAADAIRRGDFAYADSKLNGKWASLPGGVMDPSRRAAGQGPYPATSAKQAADLRSTAATRDATRAGGGLFAAAMGNKTPLNTNLARNSPDTQNFTKWGKNLDTTTPIKPHDIRTPHGVNSTPMPGSMVWVFFHGGDIQKPIYFASVTEPNSMGRNEPGNVAADLYKSQTSGGVPGVPNTSNNLSQGDKNLQQVGVDKNGQPVYADMSNLASVAKNLADAGGKLANGNSRTGQNCWAGVKTSLLAAGLVDSYPSTGYASQAGDELESKYGFTKLNTSDPLQAPNGAVIVYANSADPRGHVEIKSTDSSGNTKWVSDLSRNNPDSLNRPSTVRVTGIYVKA